MSHSPLLISGASGRLGQTVVQTLIAQGVHRQRHLILTTRTPEKLANYEQPGVEVRLADFDDPSELAYAFRGAARMLLISTNLLDGTGGRVQQHRHAIEAAQDADIRHVIYTSFIQPLHGYAMPPAMDHLATESLIKQSSMSYTVLRNAFYYDMLLPAFKQALTTGIISGATGSASTAYIARHDCGLAAARALISDSTSSETFTLTGETINMQMLADVFSRLLSGSISYQPLSLAQKRTDLTNAGLSLATAELLVSIDSALAQGALEIESPDFRQLTGLHALSVQDFIAQQLAVG